MTATATIHRSKVGTYHPTPQTSGLCPVCGERVTETGRTTDGRYIYSCGDAYREPLSADVAWTINDTRGYTDGGPACDECGACECSWCPCPDDTICHPSSRNPRGTPWHSCECGEHSDGVMDDDTNGECIGLSFAFICLDGGESLCEECAEREGITIVDCDCE